MTREEAKKILILYRPGVSDDNDPQFAAALDLVRCDPELAAWFQQQCTVFDAIRGKLKSIPVPQGLRRQIIVEHVENTRILPLTSRLLLVSAIAALALLTAVIWFQFNPGPQKGFENYRDIVARKVQRGYFMDMHEKNQANIRKFFQARGAPSNYVLPAGLGKLPGEGGVVFNWNRHPVSLLCLDAAGKPGEKNDLYLFITDRSGVPGAPAPGEKPSFKQVNLFMTMTWSVGDRVYLLTASGGEDQAALEKYLE